MDWRHKAACLDKDPELFFPIGNTGPALLQIEEAKQVCRGMHVRDALSAVGSGSRPGSRCLGAASAKTSGVRSSGAQRGPGSESA